jgi:hypothetical protein
MKHRTPLCEIDDIDRVEFFKRDEITTDLICCEISANGSNWIYHEEMLGWDEHIDTLSILPGFAKDWFVRVSQPSFAASNFVAFERTSA